MIITQKKFSEQFKKFLEKEKNIWQTPEWGLFQGSIGKKVFSIGNDNFLSLVIKQDLGFGQNFLHVQKGPLGQSDDDFFIDLREIAIKEGSSFIRVSQMADKDNNKEVFFNGVKFPSVGDIFPKTSLFINLDKSEDDILMEMKQKGRYNIRLAQKKGVKILEEKNPEKGAEIFYNLAVETTQRDGFSGHKKEVYQTMIESLGEKSKVYIGYFGDQPICAGIFTYSGDTALYYYGASGNSYRNLMAPYFLQWNAIIEAKKMGFKYYDFFGISGDEKNKKDPWYGITSFKTKFGGEKVEYENGFDIPINYLKYFLYRAKKFLR